ncbi:MAG: iron ABC transporter permease [Treponema sp.]|nr:iron ABC transporter permease [Treponema sp.]
MKRRPPLFMLFLILALIPVFLWGLLSGSAGLGAGEMAGAFRYLLDRRGDRTAALVLFGIRLPRVLMAMAAGASLGVSGAAFQGLFRNALADPYIIGASSGASLGAGIAISFGLSLGPFPPAPLFAFAGSLLAVMLAFVISRSAGNPPPAASLLLAGTSVGALFSSLLSLVLVIRDRNLYQVYYWLLGSLGGASWASLRPVLPVMTAGCIVVFIFSRPLDLLIQGDETAESLGVNVNRMRLVIAAGASLAAAAAVAAAGIIGFVGLIAPHGARLFAGPGHRRLLPAAALGGALMLAAADTLARTVVPPMEIPLGIITGLGGAPFFLYLLARHGRSLGRLS